MNHWSVDSKFLARFPQKYTLWKLEQLINYGLGEKRIKKNLLKKNLDKLHIDPQKKKYLRFILNA